MTTTVSTPHDLLALAGKNLGASSWMPIPQSDIDMFAKATHDEQWIHTDPERAKDGPFGGTIAHGLLTLSLVIPMWFELVQVRNAGMVINYGLNRVRFPSPVPSGARVRMEATLSQAEEVAGGAVQVTVDAVISAEDAAKPACVAEIIFRYYRS
jgi:acyl dehydratase